MKNLNKTIQLSASIALLFAIIMPVISYFFIANIVYAERVIAEYDALRILKSSGKLALSLYDRELCKEYGLWGVEEANIDLREAEKILAKLPRLVDENLQLKVKDDLYEQNILKEQILRFMKVRAPICLADDCLERIRSAAKYRSMLALPSAGGSVHKQHEDNNAQNNYREAEEDLKSLPELLSTKQKDSEENTYDEEAFLDNLSAEDKDFLNSLLGNFSRHILPVYEAMGSEQATGIENFRPDLIENLAGKVDFILDKGIGVSWEQMSIAEYALLNFPAYINRENGIGKKTIIYTVNGVSLNELAEKRPQELEQIASGRENINAAQRYCDAHIIGFRFVPQYLAAERSSSRKAKYTTWSEILSKGLLILSLGQVDIPPEVLKYFVQAAHSLYLAQKDLKELKKGEGLNFWPLEAVAYIKPGYRDYRFFYRDYLRLILYSQAEDKLLQEIARIIKKQKPGPYYTGLSLSLDVNQRVFSYEFAYLDDEQQDLADLVK